ncbi:hypothetical protein HDV64DRAFT_179813 [Trichoderma sp. TUCIM 5745]
MLSVAPIWCVYVLSSWSKVNRPGLGRPNRKSTVKRAQKAKGICKGTQIMPFSIPVSERLQNEREIGKKKMVRLRKFGSCDACKTNQNKQMAGYKRGGLRTFPATRLAKRLRHRGQLSRQARIKSTLFLA